MNDAQQGTRTGAVSLATVLLFLAVPTPQASAAGDCPLYSHGVAPWSRDFTNGEYASRWDIAREQANGLNWGQDTTRVQGSGSAVQIDGASSSKQFLFMKGLSVRGGTVVGIELALERLSIGGGGYLGIGAARSDHSDSAWSSVFRYYNGFGDGWSWLGDVPLDASRTYRVLLDTRIGQMSVSDAQDNLLWSRIWFTWALSPDAFYTFGLFTGNEGSSVVLRSYSILFAGAATTVGSRVDDFESGQAPVDWVSYPTGAWVVDETAAASGTHALHSPPGDSYRSLTFTTEAPGGRNAFQFAFRGHLRGGLGILATPTDPPVAASTGQPGLITLFPNGESQLWWIASDCDGSYHDYEWQPLGFVLPEGRWTVTVLVGGDQGLLGISSANEIWIDDLQYTPVTPVADLPLPIRPLAMLDIGSPDGPQALERAGVPLCRTVELAAACYELRSAADFREASLSRYSALVVPSLPWYHPGRAEILAALNARASDIDSFVLNGGGIVAFAESEDDGAWSWVPRANTSPIGFDDSYGDDVAITTLGGQHPIYAGLSSESLSGWGWSFNNHFPYYPRYLQAIATDGEGGPAVALAGSYGLGCVFATGQRVDIAAYGSDNPAAVQLARNAVEWTTHCPLGPAPPDNL